MLKGQNILAMQTYFLKSKYSLFLIISIIFISLYSFAEEANPDVIVSFEASSSALFLDAMGKNHLPLVTMFHFPTAMAVNWDDPQERQALLDSDVVQVLMNADDECRYR